jgi:hypothetical protein
VVFVLIVVRLAPFNDFQSSDVVTLYVCVGECSERRLLLGVPAQGTAGIAAVAALPRQASRPRTEYELRL